MIKRLFLAIAVLAPTFAAAQPVGVVTRPSAYSVRMTAGRFATAVRAADWVVFGEIDHAAAARHAGLALVPRLVIMFGNPNGGTPVMRDHPTLALDLPMRVLVWADDAGKVFVSRSSGADIATRIFVRHGIAVSDDAQHGTEQMLADLVRQAGQ